VGPPSGGAFHRETKRRGPLVSRNAEEKGEKASIHPHSKTRIKRYMRLTVKGGQSRPTLFQPGKGDEPSELREKKAPGGRRSRSPLGG